MRRSRYCVDHMPVNIEIKARCSDPDGARTVLFTAGARRIGLDHQIDTYYLVPHGRMKLRQGTIENNLIYYSRPDGTEPKKSEVILSPTTDPESLRSLLGHAIGVKCVVDKKREIYFHGNVKIHVDEVVGLGSFIEIEVIEESSNVDESSMLATCNAWMQRLDIRREDLLASSYSDMLEVGN